MKLKQSKLNPEATFIVSQNESTCSCSYTSSCDCMADLVLTLNGSAGYDSALWTYTDIPGEKAFCCSFLGLEGFWVDDTDDAAKKLLERLSWASDFVEVRGS